jgi:hypothetical protein
MKNLKISFSFNSISEFELVHSSFEIAFFIKKINFKQQLNLKEIKLLPSILLSLFIEIPY